MTEFELIARIGQLFAGVPRNDFEEPGDDCTVLGIGGSESLLFTADLLTEGIHFLRNTTPPYELGRKALAVNLSDVAAMGGRSVATLLSVALPPDVSDEWTEAFLRGYRDLSAEEGVMLAGGDTTSSRHDITVNVTVVGRAADHCIKRRSDARAGDAIVVAGPLRVPDCATCWPATSTLPMPVYTTHPPHRRPKVSGSANARRCTP